LGIKGRLIYLPLLNSTLLTQSRIRVNLRIPPAPEPPPNNSFTSAFAISGRSYPRNDRAAIAGKEDKNVKITDFCFLVPGHAIRA